MPEADFRGRGLSLWWLPPPKLGERLQGLIDALAARLGTPSFPPHVTVEGGLSGHPEELVATLQGAPAARVAPELRQVGVDSGVAWNHLLFLDLARTPEVDQARIATCTALGRTVSTASFRPHLSLAYGRMDAPSRAALRRSVKLQLPPFHPVALALVDTRGTVADWWEVHRWPLAGATSIRSDRTDGS